VVGGKSKARGDGGEDAEELRLETAENGGGGGASYRASQGDFADSGSELRRSSLAITRLAHVHPGSPKASGRRRRGVVMLVVLVVVKGKRVERKRGLYSPTESWSLTRWCVRDIDKSDRRWFSEVHVQTEHDVQAHLSDTSMGKGCIGQFSTRVSDLR
jgi:hypothetical protein